MTPAIGAYWFSPARMCFATRSYSTGGAENSGKPWDRFRAPSSEASRDMIVKIVVPTCGRRESMTPGNVGIGRPSPREDHLGDLLPGGARQQPVEPSAHLRVRRELEPSVAEHRQVRRVGDVGERELALEPLPVGESGLEHGQEPRQLLAPRLRRLGIAGPLPELLDALIRR